jgi:transposase
MPSYTEEFKKEAVRLVQEEGMTIAQVKKILGVSYNAIRKWLDESQNPRSNTKLSNDEKEELRRLRKEVKELRMEREILKKAATFFAKEIK